METKKDRSYLWVSPLAAGIILTLIFKTAHRFPGDTHIFLYTDYYVQFMEYIVMFWRKLLSGNGLFYSFDLGLGAGTWEHYSFYGLSPFNVVFLLIKDADTAAYVLLLVKVCVIATCMHLFLAKGMKVRESVAVLFSLSYALCAYVINFHYGIVLIDYLYLLPLIMLMMIRLFETGKPGGLAAAYAFSFLTAYYGGYMIGIFSFVCFLLMLFNGKYGFSKKTLFIRYAVAVASAVAVSAVVTLPTAAAVLFGGTGESGIVADTGLSLWDILADLFPLRVISAQTVQPSVYCGLTALIFTIGFFADRKITLKRKITPFFMLAFLLICTLIKPLYLMMHGFDEPDGYFFRFAFMCCFCLAAIGAKWAEEMDSSCGVLPFVITMAVQLVLTVLGLIKSEGNVDDRGVMEAGLVIFFIFVYYFAMKKAGRFKYGIICAALCVELFVNGLYSLSPDAVDLTRWKETYDLWISHGREAMDRIAEAEQAEGTEDFYRVNFRKGLWTNDPMYFGYHGIGYFSSMEQRQTRQLMHGMGYATGKRVVAEKGGSPFSEMILAQKYRVVTDPDIRNAGCENVEVYKNEYVLPLAFMVSEDITKAEMGNDAFENQQRIADAMLGHEETIWNEYEGDAQIFSENADISRQDDTYHVERKGAGEGVVAFSIFTDKDADIYAYFSRKNAVLNTGFPVVFTDGENESMSLIMSSHLSMPAIMKTGHDGERSNAYILFKEESIDSADFDDYHFAEFDKEGLGRVYEELKAGGLNISRMKDYKIEGSIRVSEDKDIMFTSIPYDRNWRILVDGEETEVFPVLDGAFLACRLPVGEHEVIIRYENTYIGIGALISLAGILAFILLMRRYRGK